MSSGWFEFEGHRNRQRREGSKVAMVFVPNATLARQLWGKRVDGYQVVGVAEVLDLPGFGRPRMRDTRTTLDIRTTLDLCDRWRQEGSRTCANSQAPQARTRAGTTWGPPRGTPWGTPAGASPGPRLAQLDLDPRRGESAAARGEQPRWPHAHRLGLRRTEPLAAARRRLAPANGARTRGDPYPKGLRTCGVGTPDRVNPTIGSFPHGLARASPAPQPVARL